ncbi:MULTISPECIES: fluoride efflux transporter CrcB [unclassified Rhodococcus (in: high G+C Gram-positive bacteria)]|uniref:fluoride efflux transporter CrcB n=1 Tax=unclassified Rhodococcus (in: high G+C Gram-positive bacteria) TaxID=192944 RepID=UPI001639E134|nr:MULTISPECIES: fluoride efflux transporter CrcB [unclassified Rhodococcus (in: high G+C Gram-positive bacteria)]MBC2643610.1 fluoride efflux transporter CrcB [Rhodococcus sp. 3A]MBC2891649.1 fluoride efflux transporter CrcB [Rhodococcus sp. 4CII]
MTVLLVGLGGALGATTRYLAGRYVDSYRSFPVATFVVNVAGCLILGLLAGASLSAQTFALLGTGFCGGLTTYSTFAVESVGLARIRHTLTSLVYVVASVAFGLAAAWLGFRSTS